MTKFVEIWDGSDFATEHFFGIIYLKDNKLFARGPDAKIIQYMFQDGIYLKDGWHKDPQEVFENAYMQFKNAYFYATIIKEEAKQPFLEYDEIEIKWNYYCLKTQKFLQSLNGKKING